MKNPRTKRMYLGLLFIACVVLFIFLIKKYFDHVDIIASTSVPMLTCKPSSELNKEVLGVKLRKLSNGILELQRSLYTSSKHFNYLGNQVKMVNNMLKILQDAGEGTNGTGSTRPEICPERFVNKDFANGAPYYHLGHSRTNCKEFVPIHQLITLLMYLPNEFSKPAMNYLEIMQGVAKYYPEIRVILATSKEFPNGVIQEMSALKISFKNMVITGRKGSMWANLLNQVETPYVLIAPYITHFDDDIDLYRLVRVLSYRDDVAVVGGSYRNLTGHWDLGCRQVSFNYWTAKYTVGYYESFNKCVVCDYLPGPFAAKTKLLKRLKFDTSLSDGVFRDLFWRLKRLNTAGNLAVVCADVMFNIDTPHIPDAALVSFAAKHDIKKIFASDGTVKWYGCRRGLSYTKNKKCSWPNGIGAPPCDLWNLGEVVKVVMQACEKGGMHCEYAAGNVLGAVKFASVIPWEKDADIHFHTKNFTAFRKLEGKFRNAGFGFSAHPGGLGGFSISTKRWRLSMYGRKSLEVGDMISQGKIPTRVPMSGAWVTVPRNPGMFARNHYVTNYFRHAEHHGGDSFYAAGQFKKCPTPGHSGCLDQYPADGNLQFLDYLP